MVLNYLLCIINIELSVYIVLVNYLGKFEMKLNTQGRYALIALVDLSSRSNTKNISLSEISARQNISLPYLEQLFLKLRKAGIVKSFRVSSGG